MCELGVSCVNEALDNIAEGRVPRALYLATNVAREYRNREADLRCTQESQTLIMTVRIGTERRGRGLRDEILGAYGCLNIPKAEKELLANRPHP